MSELTDLLVRQLGDIQALLWVVNWIGLVIIYKRITRLEDRLYGLVANDSEEGGA